MYRYTNYQIVVWNSIKRGFELFIHTLGVSDFMKRGFEPQLFNRGWNSIKRGFELFMHTLGVSDFMKCGLERFTHTIGV